MRGVRLTAARVAAIVLGVLLIGGVPHATGAGAASVIQVPGAQPTIQAAIDASSSGDAVVVAPGTYSENINFGGKAIEVRSSGGPSVTVIDGGGRESVVRFVSSETRASVLRGFTLRNGHAVSFRGGGVAVAQSSPTIVGNVITANSACGGGGGIGSHFGSPLIARNVIRGNGQGGCSGGIGGGVGVGGSSSAEIVDNVIQENSASFGGGIGLNAAGNPVVRRNVIQRNRATNTGGGILLSNQTDAVIVDNVIQQNESGNEGGGVYWRVPSSGRGPFLNANVIQFNRGSDGTGLFAGGYQADAVASNNVITSTDPTRAVVTCSGAELPQFSNNTVSNGSPHPYKNCGMPTPA